MVYDKLHRIISKIDADYADIRYEVNKKTEIALTGKQLTQFGANSTDGFLVRILKSGGMSSIAFTEECDIEKAIKKAIDYAELLGRYRKKQINLAETEVIKDSYKPPMIEDPRLISMDEKLELVTKYHNIPLQHKKIVVAATKYQEWLRERYFFSSEGAEIQEEILTTRIFAYITSKDGDVIENVIAGAISHNGFSKMRDIDDIFQKQTKVAIDLLKAKPVEGGTFNCVISPQLAGTFTHEAFGHNSEADLVADKPLMLKKMRIGSKLGNDVLNIWDDASQPGNFGYYKYDDEGIMLRPVQLMKNGVLSARLHSRRTAAEFSEPLTGHCIAEDYNFTPVIRMANIFIEPGKPSFNELLNMLDDGLYVGESMGGQTTGENFTFGAQYGYIVKGGQLKQMVRNINICGNLYQTLRDIIAVGNDLSFSNFGGCGKRGQYNLHSCMGAPHIFVRKLIVGGI